MTENKKDAEKLILFSLKQNPEITVEEFFKKMSDFQKDKKYENYEIFFDGDLQAICARPKRPTPRKS
mgnify:CR=1 FL=1